MPEISRFYGIVIRMYHRDHERPHFHVEYGEWKASLDVRSLQIVRGELPTRVRGMVVEWASRHRAELLINWRRMRAHSLPERIAPLE